ncbi:MFS general substrate transporter [Saccharata proteae CBS 121410]|uniref:MFS general substrate transporter n=1 Tax=Saccharata proteae CBS 121410 TaxID=1314787 RepID=A0A6A5YEV7_9PEZI|nr:MFS general substrate transporter [Saccharata proteae CBS 121410]
MDERSHRTARILSVVAATCISLACGTNYAYSAWAPQYADRMQLSATQSNLIGVAGNIGMYASGIPVGLLVDKRGPRPAAFLGSVCVAAGYFPLRKAFDSGPGSMGVALLSFLSFMTGLGSCSAFSAALKTSALNWPHHRGTATAFPLSAFGLSAFFFTTISTIAFPGNTSKFLLMLSICTFCMIFVGTLFLHVVPQPASYAALPTTDSRPNLPRNDSNPLHRTKSRESNYSGKYVPEADNEARSAPPSHDVDETSSLISEPGDITPEEDELAKSLHELHSHKPDVSGVTLFSKIECWQLFTMLGLLTGVGLMTINNIGNDAQALWTHYDDSASPSFIASRQLLHVSIISLTSFLGRLTSGVGSDYLVKVAHKSRFWCLVCSALIFTLAQFSATQIQNPNLLWILSGLTGLAYGALFGVFPALVADAFGVGGMSFNWGFMTMSPVISGNVFNLAYGSIFDHHSQPQDGGERECREGKGCYEGAYWITFFASLVGVAITVWSIRHESVVRRREVEEREARCRDA